MRFTGHSPESLLNVLQGEHVVFDQTGECEDEFRKVDRSVLIEIVRLDDVFAFVVRLLEVERVENASKFVHFDLLVGVQIEEGESTLNVAHRLGHQTRWDCIHQLTGEFLVVVREVLRLDGWSIGTGCCRHETSDLSSRLSLLLLLF